MPSEVWAAIVMQTDESTRASSSTASVGEGVGTAAAVLLREGDPHQSQAAELRDDLVRERLGPVELLGDRRHFLAREVAHRVAQQPLLVGQAEVHSAGDVMR